jgi:hypothetical protein
MPGIRHPQWEPLTAYVVDLSYPSGKMEAYLRYTGSNKLTGSGEAKLAMT